MSVRQIYVENNVHFHTFISYLRYTHVGTGTRQCCQPVTPIQSPFRYPRSRIVCRSYLTFEMEINSGKKIQAKLIIGLDGSGTASYGGKVTLT